MAPTRSKKRKSTESTSSIDVQSFPAPPQLVPTKSRSPVGTPSLRSPIKKTRMGLTVVQKQALIDNLQLEITERARKLRAQYMLQAQGLRTRIEIRVNRIPMALRRANMGELFVKYSEATSKTAAPIVLRDKPSSPTKNLVQIGQSHSRASPSPQRRPKRHSDQISADKENADLDNPKKRPRVPPKAPERTTSRTNVQPSQILSPRSANSRTLPRSPIRSNPSPTKSYLARPVSPLKPAAPVPAGGAAGILTNMVEKAKSTRGAATARKATNTAILPPAARRGKRSAAPTPAPRVGRGRASATSDTSESSSTTIVRKPVPPKKEPAKKTVMGTLRGIGAGRKAAATKPAATPAPATVASGRILRKRG